MIKESGISLESVVSKHIIEANSSQNVLGLFGPFEPFPFSSKVPLKMNFASSLHMSLVALYIFSYIYLKIYAPFNSPSFFNLYYLKFFADRFLLIILDCMDQRSNTSYILGMTRIVYSENFKIS